MGPTNATLDPLVVFQKNVIRIIAGEYFLSHNNDLFIHLEILKITDPFLHTLALNMFKNMKDFTRECEAPQATRHADAMIQVLQRLSRSQRSAGFMGTRVLN